MEVNLEEDEVIVSLDVKSLYTNVPVLESIELAADILYNSEELPPVDKETFKDLMKMAVTDVYFMCDGRWYIQTDGVAMGSSLAVILANIWMKISMTESADNLITSTAMVHKTAIPVASAFWRSWMKIFLFAVTTVTDGFILNAPI